VDLFENDPAQIWHLTDGSGDKRKDIIGFFNWDEKKTETLSIGLDKLGLPDGGSGTYVGFDYWAGEFIAPFSGELEVDLRPSSCRIISIRPLLERPVLVSTSRHVTQGIIDVTEQVWNSEKQTLAGTSKVVGGDPYELRIYAPDGSWQVTEAAVSQANIAGGVTIQTTQTGPDVRITVNSPSNRETHWKIAFRHQK